MDAEITVFPDARAMAHEAAQRFADLAREAVASRGRFTVALSGGSTPGATYALLAELPFREEVPWDGVHLFWGDERCVSPEDPESNYHLANDLFIAHVPIPADNVHRIASELAPEAAARAYDSRLRDFFCGPYPRFDLVLLGLGIDGHTASLFPGSPVLDENQQLARAAGAAYEDRPVQRVTLTLPAINSTRHAIFLVSGSAKAEIVRAVLKSAGKDLPAQRVRPTAGQVTWLVDEAAGGLLS